MYQIPTCFVVSEPNDMITFAPGTLFWAKAEGITNCSAWTLTEKTQIQCPFPLKNITLDFTNHEANNLDQEFIDLLRLKLQDFYREDIKTMLKDKKYEKQPAEAYALICNNCDVELFNHWACCQNQKCINEAEQNLFYCISCMKEHLKNCQEPNKVYFYEKYSRTDFDQFLELLKDINQTVSKQKQILFNFQGTNSDYCLYPKFCQGYLYKGTIATKCQLFHINNKLLDIDSILQGKIEENPYQKLQESENNEMKEEEQESSAIKMETEKLEKLEK